MAEKASSPWGKPGAWALDAEEHEAELQQEQQNSQRAPTEPLGGTAEFPSLAAATKQPKKKKNKTLTLAELSNYPSAKQSHEPDLLNLPTRPRERSAEELDRARIGGGFKSYGLNYRNGGEESNSRWGGGGNGNSRVSNRESSREFAPSRADEIDDWSKTKKSPVGSGYERRDRERERGSSFFDSQSKADESENWVSNKTANDGPRRFGGVNNGGFERRGSFDSLSRERHGFSGGIGAAADSDNWGRKKDESLNNGSGGERPKLNLQPKTFPLSNGNEVAGKPKGPSPFGDARPREEVLKEKGMDYKEIDEKLEAVKISSERNKDVERGDSFGRKGFGIIGGGSGNERSWRKPDVTDSGSRPQSSGTTENGSIAEDGPAIEDAAAEGN
ncbi:hypothetical protein POPTR_004G169100v4 [Populus trichocarpa]|uniref:Uncharacterized protein n=1 Tax=Populus trichocarpa TaxID=3694 RepID=A0ACC0T5Q1_POPTR|nr:eukaryotic translation initiation factor 4B3 [Populus trichocarpa]KAI9396675.1 hypothetical protein POPTR_004G169100v4 [Populus trichocarpa]